LFFDRYDQIATHGLIYYTSSYPYDFMYTATAIFMLWAVWPSVRRFGLAYGVFILINITPPLLMGGMMSIGRMTAVLFPAFLVLGAMLSPTAAIGWIAASCVLQGFVAVLFYTWRPAF
jgi:hypothetical protein